MVAAGRAAEAGKACGARVLLLEKNERLGKKLLITGGGRCNVTNAEYDTRKLVAKYGDKGKFLYSVFAQFGVKETLEFFEQRGMAVKVEAEQRVFPVSNSAQSVYDVLENYIKEGGVEVRVNAAVSGFKMNNGKIAGVHVGKEVFTAAAYIITTGGKSRPETGSTGDAYPWLTALGHNVSESDPQLVPIKIKEDWVKEMQGLPLKDVRITVFDGGVRQFADTGKILFTHFGLSGPLILNMSKDINELHKYGTASLSLDLFPSLNHQELDVKIQDVWKNEQNKKFKNSLSRLVPPKMAPVLVRLSGIEEDLFVNKVSREKRLALGKLMKDMRMSVDGFLGNEKAIVTSGGVNLEEVDFKTMRSILQPNLYFAGDILDFERPSGGFSLQICWSTGKVAGECAVKAVDNSN